MESLVVPWLLCILARPADTIWHLSVYNFCENVSEVLKGTSFSGGQSCGNILSKSHGVDTKNLPTLPYDVFGLWFHLQVQRACNWVVVTLNMRQASALST